MSKFSDHSRKKSITPSESLGEVKDQVVQPPAESLEPSAQDKVEFLYKKGITMRVVHKPVEILQQ